jgi:hypothetical protein
VAEYCLLREDSVALGVAGIGGFFDLEGKKNIKTTKQG